LALSLAFSARLHVLDRGTEALGKRVDELLAVTSDQGLRFWQAAGTVLRGWIMVKHGEVEDGMAVLKNAADTYRATGTVATAPLHTALLAGACEAAGRIEEASARLDEAEEMVEQTGERWLAAELQRRKGDLRLRQGQAEEAGELYRQAMGIARRQEAKLWELRAACSLALMLSDRGQRAEARGLLAPVYSWFTEGFDTPDLQTARALLQKLS
jgi:predicted ATPase